MDRAGLLKNLFMFSRLEAEEIDLVCGKMHEKVYAPQTAICQQGTQGSSMYVIVSGSCEVAKMTGGTETVLASLGAGDFFGEISLFDFSPRSATVRATEDSSVLEITREDFDSIVLENPVISSKILYSMMEEMAQRLRKKTDDVFLL